MLQSFFRHEDTDATNPKWEYELQYEKAFEDDEERNFTVSATGSSFAKDQSSVFANNRLSGAFSDFEQSSRSDFANVVYNFQADYTHPFSGETTLETGARYEISDNTNDYHVRELMDAEWVLVPEFTNVFDFNQNVLGIYATYAYELEKFGIKAGLRVEHTRLKTNLRTDNRQNRQDYTNAFPSFHTSYKFTEQFSVQLGYSRRIQRPGMWDLNPFYDIRDNLNISIGNPGLVPEYTHAFELTAIQTVDIGALNGAVFHRRTTDVMEEIVRVTDSLAVSTYQNIGQSNQTGLEFNGKIDPVEWLSLLADFNWLYFLRTGSYEETDFDFDNTRWSARLTAKFKLPADFDLKWRMRYRSREQLLQGYQHDMFYTDFGLRKKLLDGRAIVNFSIRDVFNSRRYIFEMDQATFYRYSERQWNRRRFVLGLSFGFGKGDALEFSGHKSF